MEKLTKDQLLSSSPYDLIINHLDSINYHFKGLLENASLKRNEVLNLSSSSRMDEFIETYLSSPKHIAEKYDREYLTVQIEFKGNLSDNKVPLFSVTFWSNDLEGIIENVTLGRIFSDEVLLESCLDWLLYAKISEEFMLKD